MDKLQAMAEAFAASIPPHLGQPTLPPLKWSQEGEIVHVVLADGRMFEASVQSINKIMFDQKLEIPKSKPDFDNIEVNIAPTVLLKTVKKPRRRQAAVKK
jgi:hypothetical protein